jgi:hypothetical protein
MQMIILVGRLLQLPVVAVLGTLGCAIAAKSGTLRVSLAYLGAVATFMLTQALATAVARMRL